MPTIYNVSAPDAGSLRTWGFGSSAREVPPGVCFSAATLVATRVKASRRRLARILLPAASSFAVLERESFRFTYARLFSDGSGST
jgi:hypothetical protein